MCSRHRSSAGGEEADTHWPGLARLCGDVLCSSWLLKSVPKPWKIEDGRQKMVQVEDRRYLYLSLVQYKNHRGKLVSGKGRECCCNRGSTKRSEKTYLLLPILSNHPCSSIPSGLHSVLSLVAPFPITSFPSSQLSMNGISASPFSNDLLWLTLLTQGESVRVFWPAVSSAVFNILVVRGPPPAHVSV